MIWTPWGLCALPLLSPPISNKHNGEELKGCVRSSPTPAAYQRAAPCAVSAAGVHHHTGQSVSAEAALCCCDHRMSTHPCSLTGRYRGIQVCTTFKGLVHIKGSAVYLTPVELGCRDVKDCLQISLLWVLMKQGNVQRLFIPFLHTMTGQEVHNFIHALQRCLSLQKA